MAFGAVAVAFVAVALAASGGWVAFVAAAAGAVAFAVAAAAAAPLGVLAASGASLDDVAPAAANQEMSSRRCICSILCAALALLNNHLVRNTLERASISLNSIIYSLAHVLSRSGPAFVETNSNKELSGAQPH